MRCVRPIPGIFCLLILFILTAGSHVDSEDFSGKLLDMTYPYDENTIYWPTAKGFELKKLDWGISEGGWWYEKIQDLGGEGRSLGRAYSWASGFNKLCPAVENRIRGRSAIESRV